MELIESYHKDLQDFPDALWIFRESGQLVVVERQEDQDLYCYACKGVDCRHTDYVCEELTSK